MNYNQYNTADISNQNVNKLSHILGEQLRKLLDKGSEQERPVRDEQPSEVIQVNRRTSEDDRLEFLGYNY